MNQGTVCDARVVQMQVAGVPIAEDGTLTGARPGQLVRMGRAAARQAIEGAA